MSLLDLFQNGGRPSPMDFLERDLQGITNRLDDLLAREREVAEQGIRETARVRDARAREINELTDQMLAIDEEDRGRRESIVTGAEPVVERGTDVLYEWYSGRRIASRRRENSHPTKNDIWVVDDLESVYHNNEEAWALASPLLYHVGAGSASGRISGNSFRPRHPLFQVGSTPGEPVYEQDLLEMSPEFEQLMATGYPDYDEIKTILREVENRNPNPFDLNHASARFLGANLMFVDLVGPGKKWDLKAQPLTDPQSYSPAAIGEWTLHHGRLRRYDDYGNIAYGVFGTYAGFTRDHLITYASVAQRIIDMDISSFLPGGGDPPRDTYYIEMGIDGYNSGRYGTPQ